MCVRETRGGREGGRESEYRGKERTRGRERKGYRDKMSHENRGREVRRESERKRDLYTVSSKVQKQYAEAIFESFLVKVKSLLCFFCCY